MKASLHNWQVKSGLNFIMGKFVDISGKRFGRLVAISGNERDKFYNAIWTCKCDCGKVVKVVLQSLKDGKTKSCGCLNREKMGKSNLIHGKSKTRIYHIWRDMRERCTKPSKFGYEYYGGRGIKVCEEWLGSNNFMNFYEWSMANGYSEELTIDRIDVNGNYCPENCRWVDLKTQSNNRGDNKFICYNGQTKTLAQWSELLNMSYFALTNRLRNGWSVEKTFTTSIKHSRKYIEYNGIKYKFSELAKMHNLKTDTFLHRLDSGWSLEDALKKPLKNIKKRKGKITIDGETVDAFLEKITETT